MEKPDKISQLEDALSEPSHGVVETLGRLEGDILILGAGGKMGPTLARMAKRASTAAGVERKVVAVSRFSSEEEANKLASAGVEIIRCDLMDQTQLQKLPEVQNVVYMVGMKFGTTGQESLTWAMNSYLPGVICEKYSQSRMVVFSTGNIYGLTPVTLGGSVETDVPNPVGEYAMSALGRERIVEHFSRTRGTQAAIIRLNYACELRYGVLVDIAQKVWNSEPVDVSMGCFNAIWQADASAMALQAFDNTSNPPFILNIAGPETLSVRRVAEQFAQIMNKPVQITGSESQDALLSNGQLGHSLYGYPRISVQEIMSWTADWVTHGWESHGKPTHFESREGKF